MNTLLLLTRKPLSWIRLLFNTKSGDLTAKVGRQVITLDGHRHVGHVGWRQDRQTFDAARVMYKASDSVSLDFTYIDQRNRIFAEEIDANSSDFLANASFKTPIGKVVAYGYLLDDETLETLNWILLV